MYDILCSMVVYNESIEKLKTNITQLLKTDLKIKLVVINNSPTNELERLRELFDLEYVFNNKNHGYGKAHNIALKKYIDSSKYMLVINPDVYVKDGCLDQLFRYMERNIDVGLVMPNVVYPTGERQYLCKLLPTPTDLILRRFLGYKSKRYEMRTRDYSQQFEAPSLSGCFMFIRSEALKNVGFFDENFFMYLEDLDLSRRINEKYKTMFYPGAEVVHEHQKASYKNIRMLVAHSVSAIKYFNKWGWI
jgi:GT2 family glycosyltransferase